METELRKLEVGEHVVFFDSFGLPHDALLTAVWGDSYLNKYEKDGETFEEMCYPCVNLLIISPDERRDDSYGRQVERATSVVHSNGQTAWGNFYCLPDQKDKAREKCIKAKNGEFNVQI